METKPFSLQSPQGIAEEYGGDKQKIAQAMQMGILDPTAATLAGMFIDRMRSAAQAERAPQQTVAQQVFTPPAPPQMPMQAPQGAPAGLGALPPGAAPDMSGMMAPPPAPEMPMPQEEAPPMSMAKGGEARDQRLPSGRETNSDFAALLASITATAASTTATLVAGYWPLLAGVCPKKRHGIVSNA